MDGNMRFEEVKRTIQPLRELLFEHPIYRSIRTMDDLRLFMEHHVFAVWDFMALLKTLQRKLTCVDVPWVPQGDLLSRRLINEIVLAEESDEDGEGGYMGHYELYHAAMRQCGADTSKVDGFLDRLRLGMGVKEALKQVGAPFAAQAFAGATWRIIEEDDLHEVAAAFTLGREDLIPDMFRSLVADLDARFPGQLTRFTYYLDRHIHLDEETHTPMAVRMLQQLCGDSDRKWKEVADTAYAALLARIDLWDGMVEAMARRYRLSA